MQASEGCDFSSEQAQHEVVEAGHVLEADLTAPSQAYTMAPNC